MNYQKKADRNQARAALLAEMTACNDGTWPRDIDDQMRWLMLPVLPLEHAEGALKAQREYVVRVLQGELTYLDRLEQRIAEGDPDLSSYEK